MFRAFFLPAVLAILSAACAGSDAGGAAASTQRYEVKISKLACSYDWVPQKAVLTATISNVGKDELSGLVVRAEFYSDRGALIHSLEGGVRPVPAGANADIKVSGPTIWPDWPRYVLLRRCVLSFVGDSRTYATTYKGQAEGRVPTDSIDPDKLPPFNPR